MNMQMLLHLSMRERLCARDLISHHKIFRQDEERAFVTCSLAFSTVQK